MPKREDLKSILIIGSGPIVIGQACEFDYSLTIFTSLKACANIQLFLFLTNPKSKKIKNIFNLYNYSILLLNF